MTTQEALKIVAEKVYGATEMWFGESHARIYFECPDGRMTIDAESIGAVASMEDDAIEASLIYYVKIQKYSEGTFVETCNPEGQSYGGVGGLEATARLLALAAALKGE